MWLTKVPSLSKFRQTESAAHRKVISLWSRRSDVWLPTSLRLLLAEFSQTTWFFDDLEPGRVVPDNYDELPDDVKKIDSKPGGRGVDFKCSDDFKTCTKTSASKLALIYIRPQLPLDRICRIDVLILGSTLYSFFGFLDSVAMAHGKVVGTCVEGDGDTFAHGQLYKEAAFGEDVCIQKGDVVTMHWNPIEWTTAFSLNDSAPVSVPFPATKDTEHTIVPLASIASDAQGSRFRLL